MQRILYGFPISSNTHRVRLMLRMLDLPFEERMVNLITGEHRKPDFLALNPIGQVPVLQEDGRTIFDSHAILLYLAETYGGKQWWPEDAFERALVTQWLFFDSNEINNGIGYARNHLAFGVPGDAQAAVSRAKAALGVLQQVLVGEAWLALDRPTLADIACAPLVTVASEASLTLEPYPAVSQWLDRVAQLPGYVPMPPFNKKRSP